ncbi:yeats-domain-containing protein [Neoconidiobolus thromboides FSU 785]|nr:yeats-domain-containing protein [Neoconidiobolus thromboides FSU 785]
MSRNIEKDFKVVTVVKDSNRFVEGNKLYAWRVHILALNDDGEPMKNHDFINKVEYILHESFGKKPQIRRDPPYALEEKGWGSFYLKIKLYFNDEKRTVYEIDHDLNVNKERYIEDHIVTFKNVSARDRSLLNPADEKEENTPPRPVRGGKRVGKAPHKAPSETKNGIETQPKRTSEGKKSLVRETREIKEASLPPRNRYAAPPQISRRTQAKAEVNRPDSDNSKDSQKMPSKIPRRAQTKVEDSKLDYDNGRNSQKDLKKARLYKEESEREIPSTERTKANNLKLFNGDKTNHNPSNDYSIFDIKDPEKLRILADPNPFRPLYGLRERSPVVDVSVFTRISRLN